MSEDQSTLDITAWQDRFRVFTEARDWQRFHTPKNLAMALAGEVGELVEIFQWLTDEESEKIMNDAKTGANVQRELADVLIYVLRIADVLRIDIPAILESKMAENAGKYPVEKARGNATKYTNL